MTSSSIPDAAGTARRRGGPQLYDFRRPNKFSREHIRALQIVGETFARQFSTVLATTLRAVSNVTLQSVDQVTYDEYIRGLENPSYMAILSLAPLPGASILHLELPVAMAVVDRMLGGPGEAPRLRRPLTDIEEHLLRSVLERALQELDYAFESLVKLEARVVTQESNPQFAQVASPSDMTVTVAFEMRVAEQRGRTTLCIPYDCLQPVLETIASQSLFSDRSAGDRANFTSRLEEALLEVPVDVTVAFNPVILTSAEIVDLQVGDVVPLHHPVKAPLTISADRVPCFSALTGRQGKRLASLVVDTERHERP
ncbi:MAG: flagellar motor switch protein FliM [Acidimicrobiia bacterium]|nr:flagellar motor switch protein FliM [Acidimicrobiia bacterium]